MGPLAGLLASLGHSVSGSDVAFDPPVGPLLEKWGIECQRGFDSAHLASQPDLVVVGNLCRKNNPEVLEAQRLGLNYTHIGGALQKFVLPGTRPLVVTGTHGKTTTAALAASLLESAGYKPGYLIGGVPHGLATSFRAAIAADTPQPFVIEGDEYDTAFFEKTAKFLHYRAEIVVLTSLEHDHIDIYPTFNSYRAPFEKLVRELPPHGFVVANADDAAVCELVERCASVPVIWYGTAPRVAREGHCVWLYSELDSGPCSESFSLSIDAQSRGRWQTPLMGRHNVSNCVAALAAVSVGYGVPLESLLEPLSEVRGVARRQQLLGTPGGVQVYDDFAHHPTAVRETLRALKRRHPKGTLWAIFEPRSATACRSLHQQEYPQSFDAAQQVVIAPVARDLPEQERLNVEALADSLRSSGVSAIAISGVQQIVAYLAEKTAPGDTVAILSNGKFGGVHGLLLQALERRVG